MKKILFLLISCSILAFSHTGSSGANLPGASWFPVKAGTTQTHMPYFCNRDITQRDTEISRLMFVIHSSSYNPLTYYRTSMRLLRQEDALHNTLVMVPHFINLKEKNVPPTYRSDCLHWRTYPFWGTQRAATKHGLSTLKISSFEVIDRMIRHVIESGNFPNLRTVTVMGHSAGGQMTQRYAASNPLDGNYTASKGITMKYIVMAPSSYVYVTDERYVPGTSYSFTRPDIDPRRYNRYGYGLDRLYGYLKPIGAIRIKNNVGSRTVLYLVGSRDNNTQHSSMSKKPAAMLQGTHRLERARIYMQYLKHVYGQDILNRNRLVVVEGAGHSGSRLMRSDAARQYIFH